MVMISTMVDGAVDKGVDDCGAGDFVAVEDEDTAQRYDRCR